MITDESITFVLVGKEAEVDFHLTFEFPTQPSFLSVIIPVYNDASGLTDTLQSLLAHEASRNKFEVIVVNDGGSAEIASVCLQYDVLNISQVPNRGSYAARNLGISAARGEYVALLDADVVVSESWLEAAFVAAQQWDVVAGRVRMKVGPNPSLSECYQAISFFPENRNLPLQPFITTANVLIHRKIFEKLGGFDSRLRSGGDYEFSQRAAEAGYALGFSASLQVTHPCRNYGQLLSSIRRTLYGQMNLRKLYGTKFKNTPLEVPSIAKLLLPRRNIFQNDVPELNLTPWTKTRLFLFAWWIKLQMIPMILQIKNRSKQVP